MEFKKKADGFANFTADSAFACCKTTRAAFDRTWLLSAREKERLAWHRSDQPLFSSKYHCRVRITTKIG